MTCNAAEVDNSLGLSFQLGWILQTLMKQGNKFPLFDFIEIC